MPARLLRRTLLALSLSAALVAAGCASDEQEQAGDASATELPPAGENDVHLFIFNDFHGNLEVPTGSAGQIDGVDVGGGAYLATHLTQLREAYPDSAVLLNGDNINASPLVSSLFDDEPTIKFLNHIGADASSVGNHEFDRGTVELQRIQEGGCAPDGCQPGEPFEGAQFPYLAANVTNSDGEHPSGLEPWTMIQVGDRQIGVVGVVTEETSTLVSPEGIRGYEFGDTAEAVNRYVPEMQDAGADAIVALVHDGGQQQVDEPDINSCENISEPVTALATDTDDAVDVIATAHSHGVYNCEINGKTVTQAGSYGGLITDVTLTFDDGVTSSAVNRPVTRDVEPDPEVVELIDFYTQEAAPRADRVLGEVGEPLTRDPYPGGDTALGNLIADAMLAATAGPDNADADIAFMNPGGVRADLDAGEITFGDAYTVQPFGNQVVTVTLTGSQLLRLLEEQWSEPDSPTILGLAGITYNYDPDTDGDRVDPASIMVGDEPFNSVATYRVSTNNFLVGGGDGFTVFGEGTDQTVGDGDLVILEQYLQANPELEVPPSRINAG